MQDRTLSIGIPANFTTVWRTGAVKNVGEKVRGGFSQEFLIPRYSNSEVRSRQDDMFLSACYCVQENKMTNSGAVLEEMNEITGFGSK